MQSFTRPTVSVTHISGIFSGFGAWYFAEHKYEIEICRIPHAKKTSSIWTLLKRITRKTSTCAKFWVFLDKCQIMLLFLKKFVGEFPSIFMNTMCEFTNCEDETWVLLFVTTKIQLQKQLLLHNFFPFLLYRNFQKL